MTMKFIVYVVIDKIWMNVRHINQDYEKGVDEFLPFAWKSGESMFN